MGERVCAARAACKASPLSKSRAAFSVLIPMRPPRICAGIISLNVSASGQCALTLMPRASSTNPGRMAG